VSSLPNAVAVPTLKALPPNPEIGIRQMRFKLGPWAAAAIVGVRWLSGSGEPYPECRILRPAQAIPDMERQAQPGQAGIEY